MNSSGNDTRQNRQFKLTQRPVGLPKRTDFAFATEPVRELGPGEVLVKVLYISLDPAMRGWMREGKSYIAPVELGEVMRAGGIGQVIASNEPKLAVGDTVTGITGVQDYCIAKAGQVNRQWHRRRRRLLKRPRSHPLWDDRYRAIRTMP